MLSQICTFSHTVPLSCKPCTRIVRSKIRAFTWLKSPKPICCCCSTTKSCPTLWDPMDSSMPGFPVLHYLPVCPDSYPLSQRCYLTISSSVAPFSFCLPSFPASGSFPVSQYWSFSFSISPSNEYSGWFSLGLTGLISLHTKELSEVFSSTTVRKHQFFGTQPSLQSNSHTHTGLLEK